MEDTNKETNNENQENYEQNQDILNSLKQMLFKGGSQKRRAVKDSYKFWDTQPVPKMNTEDAIEVGPIDADNDVEKERQEPYKLPTVFSWYDMEIHDDKELMIVILFIILAL
jgi:hypothetical protein